MKKIFGNQLIVLITSIIILILIVFLSSIGSSVIAVILVLFVVHTLYLTINFIYTLISFISSFFKEEISTLRYFFKLLGATSILVVIITIYILAIGGAILILLPFF